MASRPFHQEKKDGSYKWYKKEREEDSMEGRGRSRRHSPQREWKRRLSSVLAVVLTVVMVLNMPLSIDGLGLRISNAFASGNGTGQDSVWATASNAKYKQGDSKDVDIYVIAEDNGVVPGNTSSMTLYLKNNTDQEITEGVLTFKGRYINKEDVTFQDIGAGEIFDTVIAGGGPGTPSQDTAESAEDSAAGAAAFPEASGEGLLYQEVQGTEADGNDAALMDDGNGAALIDDDNDAEPAGDDFDAENGDVEENDEDEEEPWKLEEIDLQPGELHEIHFEFYTEEDIKSTKANVTFSFRGENEEGSRVESSTKFYYSIGLPTVNFSMEDGMQIESGVSNDLEIWMSEPDWVDEDLEEKLLEQEEKKEEEEMKDDEEDAAGGTESETASDSEASKDALKASNSNASKNETASDSNADKDNSNTVSQEDEEKIDKYTQEAMEISESRVNYTVEIFGAKVDLHARKTVEAEDIGWISCVYEVDTNTEPGIYYGKVTASGKWNKKDFTSEQGFLFEVTGEAVREYVEETDNVIVRANAEASVLPKNVKLVVKELREDDSDTADQYLEAKEALDTEGTAYEGMMALDISFVNEDGEEIEPDGEVQVAIELKEGALPEDADPETVEVQHHIKTEASIPAQVEPVADAADNTDGIVALAEELTEEDEISISDEAVAVAAFSVDSFSTFTITWGNYSNSRVQINVHYYSESNISLTGNESEIPIYNSGRDAFANYSDRMTEEGYTYIGARLNSISGTEVTHFQTSTTGRGQNLTYTIAFYKDNTQQGPTYSYNSSNIPDVYLVYQKNATGPLTIQDNIVERGELTAVPDETISSQVAEYKWFRSEDGITFGDPIKKVDYEDGISHISGDKNANINISVDSWEQETNSRYYYQVKAYDSDGELLATSEPFLNPYYIELKNGSFETPDNNDNPKSPGAFEWTQENYLNGGGVWKTTAEPDEIIGGAYNEIEILRINKTDGRSTALKKYFGWGSDLQEVTPDGVQFAELNGGNAGALYQDVLTLEGQQLNYWLSHRARGNKNSTEYDTMYLVIMPTKEAIDNSLTTQTQLESYLRSHGVTNPSLGYSAVGEAKVYDQNGIVIYRITSNDQAWHSFSKTDYEAASYLTRFFFVSGATAVGNKTEGNFLDQVGFSTKLPPTKPDKGHLQVVKVVNGLSNDERRSYEISLSGTPEGNDKLDNFNKNSQDSVAYLDLVAGGTYTITESVPEQLKAELAEKYNVISTVSVNDGQAVNGESAQVSITANETSKIVFTNTYTRKSGSITVKKQVEGNMADTTKEFDFVLSLKDGSDLYTADLTVNGVEYKYNDKIEGYSENPISGYEFKLSHGEEIKFEVPYGYEWTVQEKIPTGYTGVSYQIGNEPAVENSYIASGTNLNNETVTFTNKKSINTPTGFTTGYYPYLMMLAVAAVGSVSFIYPSCRKKRRRADNRN